MATTTRIRIETDLIDADRANLMDALAHSCEGCIYAQHDYWGIIDTEHPEYLEELIASDERIVNYFPVPR